MEEQDTSSQDQRQAIRVEVSFPIAYRLLPPGEVDDLKDEIRNHRTLDKLGIPTVSLRDLPADLTELENQDDYKEVHPWVFKMWISLERRLDYLIQLLSRREESGNGFRRGVCKSISVLGIQFVCEEEIPIGTAVYLRVQTPTFPLNVIDILGAVQRCERTEDRDKRWRISLPYDAINPEDREDLISFIFKRQREQLRHRTGL